MISILLINISILIININILSIHRLDIKSSRSVTKLLEFIIINIIESIKAI